MRRLAQDESGSVILFAALLLPALVGFGALGIDAATLYVTKSQLQNAADAGALGAALLLLDDRPDATSAAITLASKNVSTYSGTIVNADDVQFGTYDRVAKIFAVSNSNVNAVRVTAQRTSARGNAAPTFFANVWGISSADISASALAVAVPPPACLYVMHPTASGAFSLTGSATVSMPNCSAQINSNDFKALSSDGSSSMTTKSTCVVGNYSGSGYSPLPKTNCPSRPDPMAAVPEPTPPSGCYMSGASINSNTTLPPNVSYCGNIHISGSANVQLQSGIYYLKGANLKVSNTGSISGSNVMIYLDANSTIDFGSSGTFNLTSPQSGPYRGILFFQSRSTPVGVVNRIVGTPNMVLDGSFYMPKSILRMSGSSGIHIKAGYAIVNQLDLGGSAKFEFNKYSRTIASAFSTRATLVD